MHRCPRDAPGEPDSAAGGGPGGAQAVAVAAGQRWRLRRPADRHLARALARPQPRRTPRPAGAAVGLRCGTGRRQDSRELCFSGFTAHHCRRHYRGHHCRRHYRHHYCQPQHGPLLAGQCVPCVTTRACQGDGDRSRCVRWRVCSSCLSLGSASRQVRSAQRQTLARTTRCRHHQHRQCCCRGAAPGLETAAPCTKGRLRRCSVDGERREESEKVE